MKPIKTVKPIKPVEPLKPVKPMKPLKPRRPAKPIKPVISRFTNITDHDLMTYIPITCNMVVICYLNHLVFFF